MENVLKAFPQELQRYDLWAFPDTTDSKLFKFKVNFSPFHLHLQNHRANFNQTEHKALLGEGRGYGFVPMEGHAFFKRG